MKSFLVISFLCLASVAVSAQWIKQNVNTTASLRGLSVVNDKVVWASGTGGTVIRTVDSGKTWNVIIVPGAEKLDFRDIEAFDDKTAYILSIGNGDNSRIYKTLDGGKNWRLEFQNDNPKAFFDAIACWDQEHCLAMSDPVDGKFIVLRRSPGSKGNIGVRATIWAHFIYGQGPDALPGEAAFAASGTCLITQGKNNAFIATGGADARVLRSTDRGITWTAANTPIVHGTPGSGIFSIAMIDDKNGVIVGGNYEKPSERSNTLALTFDGGVHWQLGSRLNGYRSAVLQTDRQTIIAVGTTGSDISYDRRLLWNGFASENLNSIAAKGKNSIWAVGPNGTICHLNADSLVTNRETFNPKKADYPHLANVDSLNLSHSEISSACVSKGTECSDKPKITVWALGPDFASPHEYLYSVTGGVINGDGPTVEWNLSGVKPGKYSITAGISIPAFPSLADTFWEVFGKTQTRVVVIH